MDLRPTPEQQHLVDTFASLYGREATPDRVRAAEPGGFDKALWERLEDLGAVSMAVEGATLLDLALVAEQHGRFVAPAPLIEAQVSTRLLGRMPPHLTTLALRPLRGSVARMVPAGAVASSMIVFDGDQILVVPIDDPDPIENLGSMPVADIAVESIPGAPCLARGPAARALFETAIDEWQVLTANAVVGIAARALEIGVDYVRDRQAFGVPIGSFQAVAHRLADAATAVDGARLLAREAAWAAEAEPARFPELAAMALAFASEAARDATYWALHFHGGYGFMLEFDIQLYYRRARAWPRVLGSGYGRVADRRYGRP